MENEDSCMLDWLGKQTNVMFNISAESSGNSVILYVNGNYFSSTSIRQALEDAMLYEQDKFTPKDKEPKGWGSV
jgi:hypothetical protein